jgi:hypothetical protein
MSNHIFLDEEIKKLKDKPYIPGSQDPNEWTEDMVSPPKSKKEIEEMQLYMTDDEIVPVDSPLTGDVIPQSSSEDFSSIDPDQTKASDGNKDNK